MDTTIIVDQNYFSNLYNYILPSTVSTASLLTLVYYKVEFAYLTPW